MMTFNSGTLVTKDKEIASNEGKTVGDKANESDEKLKELSSNSMQVEQNMQRNTTNPEGLAEDGMVIH